MTIWKFMRRILGLAPSKPLPPEKLLVDREGVIYLPVREVKLKAKP